MLIRRAPRFKSSEITDERLYLRRREFISGAAAAALVPLALGADRAEASKTPAGAPLKAAKNAKYVSSDPPTDFQSATTYNNFYEFGTDKEDPARNGHTLKPRPWAVQIDGLVAKPGKLDLDQILSLAPLAERVYSLRCVEAWSMVIPWIGYPLSVLLKRAEPTSQAKFVEFTTLVDPEQFPAQKKGLLSFGGLDWPYLEGLRLDEAMHPLTLLTFGMYGQVLPNQNGAPIRMVIPWKYGFKSIKSIVRIRLVTEQPKITWEKT